MLENWKTAEPQSNETWYKEVMKWYIPFQKFQWLLQHHRCKTTRTWKFNQMEKSMHSSILSGKKIVQVSLPTSAEASSACDLRMKNAIPCTEVLLKESTSQSQNKQLCWTMLHMPCRCWFPNQILGRCFQSTNSATKTYIKQSTSSMARGESGRFREMETMNGHKVWWKYLDTKIRNVIETLHGWVQIIQKAMLFVHIWLKLSYSTVLFTWHVVCMYFGPWLSLRLWSSTILIICKVTVLKVTVRSLLFASRFLLCFFLRCSRVLCEGTWKIRWVLGEAMHMMCLRELGCSNWLLSLLAI